MQRVPSISNQMCAQSKNPFYIALTDIQALFFCDSIVQFLRGLGSNNRILLITNALKKREKTNQI